MGNCFSHRQDDEHVTTLRKPHRPRDTIVKFDHISFDSQQYTFVIGGGLAGATLLVVELERSELAIALLLQAASTPPRVPLRALAADFASFPLAALRAALLHPPPLARILCCILRLCRRRDGSACDGLVGRQDLQLHSRQIDATVV